MGSLHSQDHYKAVVKELRAAGYEWTEHHGGVHSYLAVQVNGRIEKVTLADSPSDWRAPRTARAQIRKRIRQWKADAAGCRAETASALLPTMEAEGTMDDIIPDKAQSMDHLVLVRDRSVVADSRSVAAKFEREHKSVLRAIRNLLRDAPQVGCNFAPFKNNDLVGDTSHYEMTRDGFTLLAMGFTGAKALRWKVRYIEAFNAMEMALTGPKQDAMGDETDAFLSILAETRSDLLTAQQSGAVTAIEHIDGSKAAILHYIKTYLRGPADDFYADMRGAAANRVLRDTAMRDAMVALTGAVTELLRRAKPAVDERPFFWSEWFDTARIYAEHFPGRAIPKKGFLSMAIAKGLDSHCKQHRKFHHMEQRVVGGHPRNFWHKDSVWEWLEAGGREVVEAHIRRHMPVADVIAIDAARQARP